MIKKFNEFINESRINESRTDDKVIDEMLSLLEPLFADGTLSLEGKASRSFRWRMDIIWDEADEQKLFDTIQQIHNAGISNSRDKYDANMFAYKVKRGDYTIYFSYDTEGSFSRFYKIEITNNITKYQIQMRYDVTRHDGSVSIPFIFVGPKYASKLKTSDTESACQDVYNDIMLNIFGIEVAENTNVLIGGYNSLANRYDILAATPSQDVVEFMDNYETLDKFIVSDKELNNDKLIMKIFHDVSDHYVRIKSAALSIFHSVEDFKASYPEEEWDM